MKLNFTKEVSLKSLLILLIFFILNSQAEELSNSKSEFGVYGGSKIYEERHPVDNSFFMSQDGYMIGLILNSETYDDNLYIGSKTRLAAGEVDYTSAGTGTMTGIPDYQFETEQEQFWAGEFGTDYIDRNKGDALLASNLNFFGGEYKTLIMRRTRC